MTEYSSDTTRQPRDMQSCAPEWVLEEDPETYQSMHQIISKKSVAELDTFIETKSKKYRLGPRSFSTSLSPDPVQHRPSLLMLACHCRRDEVGVYLLSRYPHLLNINHMEWCRLRPGSTVGAIWVLMSPLHAAAASGILAAVKLLIRMGADVNGRTCCQQTPLHIAALNFHEDVVQYLSQCDTNINLTDRFGNTPLLASFPSSNMSSLEVTKHRDIVEILLQNGANCLARNKVGLTVMHLAAMHNANEVVRLLLSFGASWKLGDGENSVLPSHLVGSLGVTEASRALLSELLQDTSPSSMIDSLLLLGSYHHSSPNERKECWREALSLREEHQVFPSAIPIAEYGSRTEIARLADLDQVMQSQLEQWYQCLIIHERCLGISNLGTLFFLQRIASLDTKNQQSLVLKYSRSCEMVWKYFPLSMPLSLVVTHFLKVSGRLYALFYTVRLTKVERGLGCYVSPIIEGLGVICSLREACLCQRDSLTSQIYLCLILVLKFLVMWSEYVNTAAGDDDREELDATVSLFVSKFLLVAKPSLLHILLLSADRFRSPLYFAGDDTTSSFLLAAVFQLELSSTRENLPLVCCLLEWGSHKVVNWAYPNGLRPIHEAVALANGASESEIRKCHAAISTLLDCGAHIDAVTREGKTALELCIREEVRSLLSPTSPLPLSCLAACAIIAGQISYQQLNYIPPHIKEFISLHDPKGSF